MKCSRKIGILGTAALLLMLSVPAQAQIRSAHDPAVTPLTPWDPAQYRSWADRTGYVRKWYVFADNPAVDGVVGGNGMLQPGDFRASEFDNWTMIDSSGTSYNLQPGRYPYNNYPAGADTIAGPRNGVNFATGGAFDSQWLLDWINNSDPGRLHFYMGYSLMDNFDYANNPNGNLTPLGIEQHIDTNGWCLGWVNQSQWQSSPWPAYSDPNVTSQTQINMDILSISL